MVSDREFIDAAAKGLKIEAEPFKPLAEKLGLSVDQVIERVGMDVHIKMTVPPLSIRECAPGDLA